VKRVWLYGAISLGIISLIPIQTLEAPSWKVLVVDESNKPVSGIMVRESYKNYSAEVEGGEQDLITDAQGRVMFSAKKVRIPLLKRALVAISSATAGVHASFGSHAHVFAFGNGVEGDSVKNGFVEDWTGAPAANDSVIVVHPTK
jgi:hypothetical protein